MRRESVVAHHDVFTKNSPWHQAARPRHWYGASTDFARHHLGRGNGRTCLVIGSPLFEAEAIEKLKWRVTYLDVRKPPRDFESFVQADATNIPLTEPFDAISTACVLTHAGLGRYGDAVVENGDELMMKEMKRLLKPGAIATVTFGGVVKADLPVRIGNMHRIYTVEEAERMCAQVDLKIEEVKIWSTANAEWVNEPTRDLGNFDYLSVLLRNVAAAE